MYELVKRIVLVCVLASLGGCMVVPPGGPFVVCPPTWPVERVYASQIGGWADRLAAVEQLGPDRVAAIEAFDERGRPAAGLLSAWTTDVWVFGRWAGGPGALDMPLDRGLDDWATTLFAGARVAHLSIGDRRPWPEARFDAGGNVLCTPPLPGSPYGRLIVGRRMQPLLKDFLRQAAVQVGPDGELIEIDTDWLAVGHVDELVGFLPMDGGGFRIVVPDAAGALKLAGEVPPQRAVFYAAGSRETAGSVSAAGPRFIEDAAADFAAGRWAYVRIIAGRGAGQVAKVRVAGAHRLAVEGVRDLRDHSGKASPSAALRAALAGRCDQMPLWFEPPDTTSRYLAVEATQFWLDGGGEPFPAVMAAGELAADPRLADAARRFDRRIDALVAWLCGRLGLDRAEDVVRLPAIVTDDGAGGGVAWLTPDPANLVNLDRAVLLLRPFGPREKPAADAEDLFARRIERTLAAAGARAILLDGWDALHRNGGGARCGTNVLRRCPKEAPVQ